MLDARYEGRCNLLICLTGLLVLATCNAAVACEITVLVWGDYVPNSWNENDYLLVSFIVIGTGEGTIFLESSEGPFAGKVRFRDENYNIVTQLSVADRNKNFWVEGITTSGAVADVTVTATLKIGGQTQDTDSDTVTVVEVDKVQYQSGESWVNITDTLYVMQGTTVTFKPVPSPGAASWPSGKPVWGGTAGATGTASTKAVTFNTLSSKLTDFKTVTAECGNTVTVNVIVYSLRDCK